MTRRFLGGCFGSPRGSCLGRLLCPSMLSRQRVQEPRSQAKDRSPGSGVGSVPTPAASTVPGMYRRGLPIRGPSRMGNCSKGGGEAQGRCPRDGDQPTWEARSSAAAEHRPPCPCSADSAPSRVFLGDVVARGRWSVPLKAAGSCWPRLLAASTSHPWFKWTQPYS